jgi:hypothetical protein
MVPFVVVMPNIILARLTAEAKGHFGILKKKNLHQ